MQDQDQAFMDWRSFDGAISSLVTEISSDKERIESVVGIARGGLPGAVAMSHAFEAELCLVNATYYDGREQRDDVSVHVYDTPTGQTLVFDDIVDTGTTMRAVVDEISQSVDSGDITTVSIHIAPERGYDPDYWAGVTDKWIVYPWEREVF